jgi:hypothetical protein
VGKVPPVRNDEEEVSQIRNGEEEWSQVRNGEKKLRLKDHEKVSTKVRNGKNTYHTSMVWKEG